MIAAHCEPIADTLPIPPIIVEARQERKLPPYRLASLEFKPTLTVIRVGNAVIGGNGFAVIAGPCSVEDEVQMVATAGAVKDAGATLLRGGAFKPRTSPYSFQGLAEEGLKLLDVARRCTGLPVVTEVMDSSDIPLVASYADVVQVGTRNSQNFSLLRKLGNIGKPVLLKRGLMTTIEEFLMSAEYILAAGNPQVILCERGIRTFETATRNTLDLSAIPVLKEKTHLPVIVDPSHAVGHSRFVSPMAKAALAVGADGIMVEVHITPETALCDGAQSLTPSAFNELMKDLRAMGTLLGRVIK
ncbi:MAG: 3-deoxy-7-phosphoheptulonate synthase [Thermodesulfobacteriota bacterium]